MAAELCEVCAHDASKYKCPHCAIRYCSIACFKTHIITHEIDDQKKLSAVTENGVPASGARDTGFSTLDGPPTETVCVALQHDSRFQQLFTKYPNLKIQLARVYAATQNTFAHKHEEDEVGRKRPRPGDRVEGQWTQDKADDLAATVLMKLREHEEGVGEFMALFPHIVGGGTNDPSDEKQLIEV